MENKRNSLWLYAAAFLIPCIILLLCFALLKIAPFGDNTVLLYDSDSQYLDFAAYLRTVFAGENDLFYSFSKNLGGEMVSLFVYYLLSPFSILFLLGTLETLPLVFTGVVVLKIGFCGLIFFHASTKRFGCKWQNLIFSTAYALMAYNTMYGWNIMWMDGVLILPLLALGLENLWQGKSSRLYVFSLAYGLLTNFYIGYMLCITSVLFSVALVAAQKIPLRERSRRFGKFVFASCIGGFSSAFAWLPTFLSMLGGRAEAVNTIFVWRRTYNILGLAGKLVAGSASEDQFTLGTPHIFCGILTIALVVAFFLHGKKATRHRMAALGVLVFLIGTSTIRGLDEIWHGFSPNNAFNFRYSFVISYVLLMIAQYAWASRREIPKLTFGVSGCLMLLMIAALVVMKRIMGLDFISPVGLVISAAVVLISTICLLGTAVPRRMGSILIALACLFELGANYYLCMKTAEAQSPMLRYGAYQDYVQQMVPVVNAVKERETGLFRMEKTFQRSRNDAMLLSYNGLTHFSSSQDKAVPRFLKKLGMTTYQEVWSEFGRDTTLAVDTFLGVKYVLSESDLPADKGYLLRDTVNGVGIYENPGALPVAMVAQADILDVNSALENCFSLQNRLWQGVTGTQSECLLEAGEWTVTPDNLAQTEPGSNIYQKINPEEEASLTYTLTIAQDLPLYGYFSAPYVQHARLQINGEDSGSYFADDKWNAFRIGTFAPGETVTVSLIPDEQELLVDGAWFYYEDMAAVTAAAEAVRTNPVDIRRNTSSHLSGSYTIREGQLLLLTIPYDTGWKLTVDGQKMDYMPAADIFIAARVPQGTHTFELQYTPKGGVAGCALSIGAILVATAWVLSQRKKKTV